MKIRTALAFLIALLCAAPAQGAEISRENGFAELSFANGKVVTGEVRQASDSSFVLDSPDGTVELRWDAVTARRSISPFDYLTQRALARLAAGDESGALGLARRAAVLETGRPLPAQIQAILDDRRRAAVAEPAELSDAAQASAEFLLKEQNYQGVIDVVSSATMTNVATAELLALGIEAEYKRHLQNLEPTTTFRSRFAPLLEKMKPDHAMLKWLNTELQSAKERQYADAHKPDMIDHIAAEEKRIQDVELAYQQIAKQLAAERIALANSYYLSRFNYSYGSGAYGPGTLYGRGTALGSRHGDLYRSANINNPNIVWVDDATRMYSDAPNVYFRNGGRPMTRDYALRNQYLPAGQN